MRGHSLGLIVSVLTMLLSCREAGQATKAVARNEEQTAAVSTTKLDEADYDFGDYPGAVLDPSSRTIVHGELVALPSDERILEVLDRYEEFYPANPKRSLFVRTKAKVRMANGSRREGWIYVYNRPPGDAKLVRGGDYLRSKVA